MPGRFFRRPGRQSRGLLASPLAAVLAGRPLGPGSPLRDVRDDELRASAEAQGASKPMNSNA